MRGVSEWTAAAAVADARGGDDRVRPAARAPRTAGGAGADRRRAARDPAPHRHGGRGRAAAGRAPAARPRRPARTRRRRPADARRRARLRRRQGQHRRRCLSNPAAASPSKARRRAPASRAPGTSRGCSRPSSNCSRRRSCACSCRHQAPPAGRADALPRLRRPGRRARRRTVPRGRAPQRLGGGRRPQPPSGDPAPSAADGAFARSPVEAGALLEIKVLDHVVFGRGRYVSMRDRGLGFP